MDKQERIRLIMSIFYEIKAKILLGNLENINFYEEKLLDLLDDLI